MVSGPPKLAGGPPADTLPEGPPAGAPVGAAGRLGAAAGLGAGVRSALRSTAPRVKIDGVVRGSLMVT
jgi:hypothetical protein